MGTDYFMSPEAYKQEEQTFAVDIWSFGMFAFQVATGTTAFSNVDPQVLPKMVTLCDPPRLNSKFP